MINSSESNLSNPQIVKYPIVTDKASRLLQNNQYTFMVARDSNKLTIKATIEDLFKVKVIKVNTCRLPRKKKRIGKYLGWKPQYKKATVRLVEGDVINLFTEN